LLESPVCTEDMEDQGDGEDLQKAVNEHCPRDQFPLLSPSSSSGRPLASVQEDEQQRDQRDDSGD
jgi:hypothetical protein